MQLAAAISFAIVARAFMPRLIQLLQYFPEQALGASRYNHGEQAAMKVYVARDKETKMLIGIFMANDIGELCGLIAEFTNPLVCEILELGAGGIFFQKKISISSADLGDVTITDLWSQRLAQLKEWATINDGNLAALRSASSYVNNQSNA
jgi:hypothetical protein